MKINIAKSAGFCFGVKRAINTALETASSTQPVYMLGDIVHNEDVVKKLDRAGIRKISRLKKAKNKTLLIRAHGCPQRIIDKAKSQGYKIVNATCPMVCEIHKISKNAEAKGYKIIVIGDNKHDEVTGIVGQLKRNALVIDPKDKLPNGLDKIKKAAVVIQSTQDIDTVNKILPILKRRIKNIRIFNTICKPTSTKQKEIKRLPIENDIVLIIGSKHSANTKRLYEISKALNPRSYWVSCWKEINPQWFKDSDKVGITAGASTPEDTIQTIVKMLLSL